jgi:hypothetical protein
MVNGQIGLGCARHPLAGMKRRAFTTPLRPRRRFAGGEHAPATAPAASQPFHECGDRRVRRDGEARQCRARQHPDVSATKALNCHCRLSGAVESYLIRC